MESFLPIWIRKRIFESFGFEKPLQFGTNDWGPPGGVQVIAVAQLVLATLPQKVRVVVVVVVVIVVVVIVAVIVVVVTVVVGARLASLPTARIR